MKHELPPTWSQAPLAEICPPVSKRGPKPDQSTFEYIDLGALNKKSKRISEPATIAVSDAPSRAKQVVRTGDTLFSNVRVYLENIALVPESLNGAIASTAFCVLRPPEDMDPRYLHYFVTSKPFVNAVNARQRGNSPPSVQDDDVRRQLIPLAPPKEQARIASKIDELFSRIEESVQALERAQTLVERYRQSVLKAAVTGELTREWREKKKDEIEPGDLVLAKALKVRREAWETSEREKMRMKGLVPRDDKWKQRYKEPCRPDLKSLPTLPAGWTWATVEQLSTKVVDGVHKKPSYVESGVPFVTVKNLTAGNGISFDKLNYITPEDHAEFTKRTDPERGDILISKDGTLGVVRVIDTDTIFSIFVSVALVKPAIRGMSDYLGLALSSPIVQAQMVPKGSGLQHIHLEDLRQDCVPICSIAEQKEIAQSVAVLMSAADRLETAARISRTRSNAARAAVLRDAFTGKLVAQEASGESAPGIAAESSDDASRPASRARQRVRASR